MIRINFALQQMKPTLAIAAALVSFTGSFIQVQAQPAKSVISTTSIEDQPTLDWPSPPPDQGTPDGRQKGGGSRGSCEAKDKRLTALVPITSEVWGLTIKEHPTFWFYVPDSLTPELPVKFVLQDKDDNEVYKTTLTAPGTPPGVIGIPIPSTATPLEIGKTYHWTFIIYCDDPKAPSKSVSVTGLVQRVTLNPDQIRQLEAATPRVRIALYAKEGIWHETLTTLAELRRTNPGDTMLAAEWENLLQSVDLKEIAPEPIVPCCIPKQ